MTRWQQLFIDHFVGVIDTAARVNCFLVLFAIAFPILIGVTLRCLRPTPAGVALGRPHAFSFTVGLLLAALAFSTLAVSGRALMGTLLAPPYYQQQIRWEAWATALERVDLLVHAETQAALEFSQLADAGTLPLAELTATDLATLTGAGNTTYCDLRLWKAQPTASWERPVIAWRITPDANDSVWVAGLARLATGRTLHPIEDVNRGFFSNQPLRRSLVPPGGVSPPGILDLVSELSINSQLVQNRNQRDEWSSTVGRVAYRLYFGPVWSEAEQALFSAPRQLRIPLTGATMQEANNLKDSITWLAVNDDDTIWMQKGDGPPHLTLRTVDAADVVKILNATNLTAGSKQTYPVEILRTEGTTIMAQLDVLEVVNKVAALQRDNPALRLNLRPVGQVEDGSVRRQRKLHTRFSDAPELIMAAECRGQVPSELARRIDVLD